jgi:DNA-directed RNA polymerase beta' subunit
MLSTTVGQLLVNESLPEDLRDYNRVLDKKGLSALLQQVAREHPDKYREVSFKLNQLGQRSAQDQGGMSFGARHLRRSQAADETRKKIQANLARVLEDDSLTDKQRADKIVRIVGREMEPQQKAILEEAIKNNNPLAMQVLSGSRGKPMNLASLLGGDMLYADHRDEVIPVPVLRSYSEGLSPEEYWAGTYGARRGIIATKFATQEAGFLSKQLNQAGHRLVVMDEEGDDSPDRGLVVDTDDPDNEGALLARDIGPYKRNTPLTPKILKHLKRLGKNRILVRSPLIGGSPEGGVYARDVGIRETGKLPGRGEQVGLQAAQALSEPISQGQLSAKHSGGVAGQEKAVGGFQYINQLIQTPKRMQGGAAHSGVDGTVQRIEDAPAGGKYVTIDSEQHYVGPGYDLKVKKGDKVEAGDLISEGIPNPSVIVQHKGVGEGRRYFVREFKKAMASSGMQGHRRNIELLARGLINHVKMTEETDEHAPDDIIPYSTLEHTYKPRLDHERLTPKKAVGQYLERPTLHYTIGTKVRPSMLKDFEEFGIKEVAVHKQPPPFQPHMVRGMYQLQHDPDWMTQMYGSGLKKSLLESTARGATSKERGTSFVPSLASGLDFGKDPSRAVIQPQKPYELPKVEQEEEQKPEQTFFGGRFKVGMAKVPTTPPIKPVVPPKPAAPAPVAAPTPEIKPTPAPQITKTPAPVQQPPQALSSNIMPQAKQPASVPQSPAAGGQLSSNFTPKQIGERLLLASPEQMRGLEVLKNSDPKVYEQILAAQNNRISEQVGHALSNDTLQGLEKNLLSYLDKSNPATANLYRQELSRQVNSIAGQLQKYSPEARQSYLEQTQLRDPKLYEMLSGFNFESGAPAGTEALSDSNLLGSIAVPLSASLAGGASYDKAIQAAKGSSPVYQKVIDPAYSKTVQPAKDVARSVGSRLTGGLINNPATARAAREATELAAREGTEAAGKRLLKKVPVVGGLVDAGFVTSDILGQMDEGKGLGEAYKAVGETRRQDIEDLFTGKKGLGDAALTSLSLFDPVSNVQQITATAPELASEIGGGISDTATGAYNYLTEDSQRRNAAKQLSQGYTQQAEGLKNQAAKLQAQSQQTQNPEQAAALAEQSRNALLQSQDAQRRAANAIDETENWKLFDQNLFGGGDYFRDNIEANLDRSKAELAEKVKSYGPEPTGFQKYELIEDQANIENMERLVQGYDRMSAGDTYNKSDFENMVRQGYRSARNMQVDIAAKLRDPAVQANPELMNQLTAELQQQYRRANQFRNWANAAAQRRVVR